VTYPAIPTESALERLCTLAAEDPDGLLMRSLDTGDELTHRNMLDQVLDWAGAYKGLGVARGSVVAVMLGLSPDAYFAWLGIAWLRAVEVPINLDLRGVLLAHVLRSSGASTVVCQSRFVERILEVSAELEALRTIVVIDEGELPEKLPWKVLRRDDFFAARQPAAAVDPPNGHDTAAVVYTSGTTGPSKGVIVPWRELSAYARCYPAQVAGEAFRMYSPWPVFHVNGKFALVETLNRHGTMVMRDRWRTEYFWEDIRNNGVTVAVIIGGISHFLWSAEPDPRDADNPLEHVLMAPVLPQFREFEQRFGVKIHTGYASSEAGQPTAAFHPLPNNRTCGRLLAEYELRLVDPDGNEVGPNTPGEALVSAREPDIMALGYWNMPEATETAWRDGWFHSGDGLMRDEDGYFYYVDRVRDSLRRRGENISSWELESLVNGHPDITESAAIAVPGDPGGDDEIMVVIVTRAGSSISGEELIAYLQPRTPRFMIPRYIRVAGELPRTHTGRVRKVELRDVGITADTWDRVEAGIRLPR